MSAAPSTLVVLGTGGTIAGAGASATDVVGYRAARIGVAELVAGVASALPLAVEAEQVAQLDSKDMTHAVWRALALAAQRHLARPEVRGVVVTHGTDTLEETAYFLARVLPAAKPLVLTAAMRPATALLSDGPQNLLDALTVAASPDARGAVVVMAGHVWSAREVRKRHAQSLQAFGGGEAGPLGGVVAGRVHAYRPWPGADDVVPSAAWQREPAGWPWVEIVTSHAGADARAVTALVAAGVQGLVVAGTGNGTVHAALHAALHAAAQQGVAVVRTTRCAGGRVIDPPGAPWRSHATLTPVQARVALMLELMAGA